MNQLILRSFHQEMQNSLGIHYCYYGCGQIAKYLSKNKKWCCESWFSKCPSQKYLYSSKQKGRAFSEEHKSKIREAKAKNTSVWLGKHHTEESKRKISKARTGMKFSKETRDKMSLAQVRLSSTDGLKTRGLFKRVKTFSVSNINNETFKLQGTWEVKMANSLNNRGILWHRGKYLNYVLDSNKRRYIPDFYLPAYDTYIEVKGFYTEKDKIKMKLVLSQNDIKLFMAFNAEMKNINQFIDNIISS